MQIHACVPGELSALALMWLFYAAVFYSACHLLEPNAAPRVYSADLNAAFITDDEQSVISVARDRTKTTQLLHFMMETFFKSSTFPLYFTTRQLHSPFLR